MGTFRGYQRNVERCSDNTPVLNTADNEQIHATYGEVTLKFNDKDHGRGAVYVTTSRLIWIASDPAEVSYAFPYLGMVLHAISKDKALCEVPCVFIQLQGDEAEEEEGEIPIVILAPARAGDVESMFEGISQMNSLVEPPASESENELEFEEYLEEEEVDELVDHSVLVPLGEQARCCRLAVLGFEAGVLFQQWAAGPEPRHDVELERAAARIEDADLVGDVALEKDLAEWHLHLDLHFENLEPIRGEVGAHALDERLETFFVAFEEFAVVAEGRSHDPEVGANRFGVAWVGGRHVLEVCYAVLQLHSTFRGQAVVEGGHCDLGSIVDHSAEVQLFDVVFAEEEII
ncbi:methylosome subunit pICln [Babesia caballi]|uniref:Methylosome subunit pICln n=1 Tax=Babesia caballi TaxID=5871 RepID=A0AAV4LLI7_BABCB|nr:methylosome subunit pICln [Babesia caballi]